VLEVALIHRIFRYEGLVKDFERERHHLVRERYEGCKQDFDD
jgi:hypothetical protein